MNDFLKFKKERQSGIGGSDIAALLGFSRYSSNIDVYNKKLGINQIFDDSNIYERFGSYNENFVFLEAQKEYPELNIIKGDFFRHHDYHFIIAHTDGFFVDKYNVKQGIIEIKTAPSYAKWEDEAPIEYQMQLQHYFLVTGLNKGYIIVMYRDTLKLERYYYEADYNLQKNIIDVCTDFWNNNILKEIPPIPNKKVDITKIMHIPNSFVKVNEIIITIMKEYNELKEKRKQINDEYEAVTEQIKLLINENEGLQYDNKIIATYKSFITNGFNLTKFKEEMPDIYNQYSEPKIQRRLSINFKGD